MTIEIVDFPSYNMVDLSIILYVYQRVALESYSRWLSHHQPDIHSMLYIFLIHDIPYIYI